MQILELDYLTTILLSNTKLETLKAKLSCKVISEDSFPGAGLAKKNLNEKETFGIIIT